MKTETVNIDKWKTFDWGAIQPNKKVPVHIKITTMDSELIADVYNKDHAELIKEATNACKEINKDSPLNVAKAIPELFEALEKYESAFQTLLKTKLGMENRESLLIHFTFVTSEAKAAIKKATEQ